jgi:hypothetical protein
LLGPDGQPIPRDELGQNLALKRQLFVAQYALGGGGFELDPTGSPIPPQNVGPVPPNEPTHQLTSPRVFLDPPAIRAALAADTNARPILTYLVNLIQAGERTTPYSMVTAAGAPFVPGDLRDDEIVINQWLAEDLKVGPGAEVALTYFRPDSGAQLAETTNRFRVRSVVPMKLPWVDRNLMPEFPGIASAEQVGNWEAGFPLKLKVRKHRFCYKATGTGKLITSLHLHLTLISLPNHVSSSSWPCDTFFFVHEKLSDFSVHPLRQKVVYWHFKHGW